MVFLIVKGRGGGVVTFLRQLNRGGGVVPLSFQKKSAESCVRGIHKFGLVVRGGSLPAAVLKKARGRR